MTIKQMCTRPKNCIVLVSRLKINYLLKKNAERERERERDRETERERERERGVL